MTIAERVWDAFRDVLRLQDKVNALSTQVTDQQRRIENVIVEIAQLRVAVSIRMSDRGVKDLPRIPVDPPRP